MTAEWNGMTIYADVCLIPVRASEQASERSVACHVKLSGYRICLFCLDPFWKGTVEFSDLARSVRFFWQGSLDWTK